VALSPDGNRVAVVRDDPQSANSDIWILDVRGIPPRFTFEPAREVEPIWASDRRIVFSSIGSSPAIFQKNGLGAKEELMLKMDVPVRANDLSPDGRYVLFAQAGNLWTVPVGLPRTGDSPTPQPYLKTPFNASQGQFSPDGHWVAYTSDETERNEIWVQSFPAGAGKFMVSTNGATQPRSRKDGGALLHSRRRETDGR
jgi:Tol biopolymer transport system component